MKKPSEIDILDYIVSRTSDFQKNPPDHVWQNISHSIKAKPSGSNLFKQLFSSKNIFYTISGIILISIVSVWYFVTAPKESTKIASINKKAPLSINTKTTIAIEPTQAETQKNTKTTIALKKNNTINLKNTQQPVAKINKSTLNSEIVKDNNAINAGLLQNNAIENKTNAITQTEKIYNINASMFNDVESIHFIDRNKNDMLTITNPKPNPYGYYAIDISKLPSGFYYIKIKTNKKGIIDYKEEVIK